MADITIKDIAKKAGVAKSTVSRVINNSGYVKEDTRQRIAEVMREYNYIPSATAQSLSRRESNAIALIIPEADNPFFSEILRVIGSVINEQGLTLILCHTENSAKNDLWTLQNIRQQRVRGIIYTPAVHCTDDKNGQAVLEILSDIGTPVVLLDRPLELKGIEFDGVFSNNFEGAYSATKALINAGHKQIGIVAGDLELFIGRERMAGYRQAMEEAGLRVLERNIIHGEFNTEITYQQTKKKLASGTYPTAYFVCNNLSSKGFLRAVFERGMKIPDDIAYVGFDPVDGLDIFGLEYSCLDRDVHSMGAEAARLLLKRINMPDRTAKVEKIILPPVLRLRGSERKAKE